MNSPTPLEGNTFRHPTPEGIPTDGGIYIHIPFCIRKCLYCDFYSITELTLKPVFIDALCKEMTLRQGLPLAFDSVYIGGGTPSVLDPLEIRRILEQLYACFSIRDGAEVTLEVNPGTVDAKRLSAYRETGINRLSIGVQSFRDELLATLGRLHSGADAQAAVQAARNAGFENLTLDLIFGIPGQTRRHWMDDLKKAVGLGPDHLSCYALSFEPETPMTRLRESGRLAPLTDGQVARQMETAWGYLIGSGYLHYEVSNFAGAPDKTSRHNRKYWEFSPYIGLGPSAHTYLAPQRQWNHADMARYLREISAGRHPAAGREILTREQQMIEALYLRLRTAEGIDTQGFDETFGVDFHAMFAGVLNELETEGKIVRSKGCCALTPRGLLFHESIAARLIDLVKP